MKAAFIVGENKIECREIKIPAIQEDEVLIRVRAIGICGTDLHFLSGVRKVPYPHLSGHEASGDVVKVGPLVQKIAVGDRVAVDPNVHCGRCWYCRRGRFNLCQHKKVIGVSLPGCFSEYIKIGENNVRKLADSVDYWQGALVEPLAVALHALNTSQVSLNQNVAVFGMGAIGLMLLQLLKVSGVYVTAIDRVASKLDQAKQFGADRVVNTAQIDFQTMLDEHVNYNKVIDAAGVPETLEASVKLAGPGSDVVWLGLPSSDVRINPFQFVYRDLVLRASLAYTYEFGDALQLIERGEIALEPLVTRRAPFEALEEVLKSQEQGDCIKSVLESL